MGAVVGGPRPCGCCKAALEVEPPESEKGPTVPGAHGWPPPFLSAPGTSSRQDPAEHGPVQGAL